MKKISRGLRWTFLWASRIAALGIALTILNFLSGLVFDADVLSASTVFLLVFQDIPLLIFMLVPIIAFLWLISALFSGDELTQADVGLATFGLVAAGIVVIFAVPDEACVELYGTYDSAVRSEFLRCLGQRAGFAFDEFGKGVFADLFEYTNWEISDLGPEVLDGLGKFYLLTYRMLSAAWAVALILRARSWFQGRSAAASNAG